MSEQRCEGHPIEEILQMLSQSQNPDALGTEEAPQGSLNPEWSSSLVGFLDEMPGGFLIYRADQDEEIIYANRAVLRIFKCGTIEEFRRHTGNSFRGVVCAEDLERVEKSIRAQVAASQQELDYVEYRIRCLDGTIRWIEDYGHFIRSEIMGDVFYVFLGDATEKHERQIREKDLIRNEGMEREKKLRSLLEEYDKERVLINEEYVRQLEVIEGLSVNYESICFVDLDLDQVQPYRLSQRTSKLFLGKLSSRSYVEYADSYVEMWVHPEDREMVAEATAPNHIREKLAESQTYYVNYRVLVEGELQYLQLRVVNVGHDEVNQVVLGYRRVDEEIQRQMEQQSLLAEALAKANLAVTSKNTFLSNMSHDMRTPLHAIFGFTTLAKLNINDPAEALDSLERVETASKQLLDMIDKVLQISSLASESAALDEVECDLRATVGDVFNFLEPQAHEKGIDFQLDCSGLRHKGVFADQEKLRQLILYLANNAVTYTNPGGRVTIRVEEGEELANQYAVYRLTVEDTGIGISQEFLDRIFEPFSREKNSTLSGVHGIGLGLTIAKNIVDMMGGVLSVQSTVGKGSTFTAALRLRIQVWRSTARKVEEQGSVRRILLAEDNEINREIELELLGELGFVIDPTENGKAALDKIKEAPAGYYDVVLMDLQMPVMDGWQASMAIRALPDRDKACIPIIALTANALENDRRRGQECGINAHLRKPMDLALLLRTIEELTGKKSAGAAD